ncbi:hypothetical protein CEXT_285861, partial [Caerostris extrusa]
LLQKELPDKRTSLYANRSLFFNKIMNRFHELHCKNRSRFPSPRDYVTPGSGKVQGFGPRFPDP